MRNSFIGLRNMWLGTLAEWRRSQVDGAGEERTFLTDFAVLGDFPPGTEGGGPVAALAVEN
jgi:hypothetical protein